MDNPCDNVSVGIVLGDAQTQGVENTVSDNLRVTDTQRFWLVMNQSDTIGFSSPTVDAFGVLVSDGIGFSVAKSDPLRAEQRVSDRFRLWELIPQLMSNTVSTSVSLTDARVHAVSAVTVDRMRVTDVAAQQQTITALVSDPIRLRDTTFQVIADFRVDSLRLTDVAAGTIRLVDLIAKTVRLTDATPTAQTLRQEVQSRVRLGDGQAQTLYALQLVVEDVFLGGELLFDSGTAWTATIDTWGMSQWSSLPGDSIGVAGGRFLIGGDGLYEEAEPTATAVVDFGITDMGSPQLKRLSYAYWHGQIDGTVLVLVGDHDAGAEQLWEYPFEAESGSQFEPMRARLGRGHRSRNYRLELQPTGTFELAELRILHDATSRKV